MTFLRSCYRSISSTSLTFTTNKTIAKLAAAVLVLLFAAMTSIAQDHSQAVNPSSPQSSQAQATSQSASVTIPAGTRMALVLTQPVQSRTTRRGDDIYAQVNAPVDSGNEVVIPPGTFVQGTVDKFERNGGVGELRLQSMAITFPDGYVTPIAGPIMLESNSGYALADPGPKRVGWGMALPIAGVGLGALIGHSVGSSQSTLTTTLPPGCVGSPPECLTSSMSVPGSSAKDTAIGAAVGGVVGGAAMFGLLFSSHHFFLAAGSPVEMVLQQPITLQQDEVAKAVKQSAEHPVAVQPVAPLPVPYIPPPGNNGTCYTPGTPGTPPSVIPGTPGPDGIPGPPTIIPGTPPTPGTPYPCP
jgi:hypothetical protein